MRILLAIDGSEASQVAVTEVIERPWPLRSVVDVITVVEPPHMWETSDTADLVFQRSAGFLGQTLERMAAAGLDATGQILQGDPKAVILDRAEQTKPSLLVLGSQSVSAVAHFLLGNVAANVLRHAPCPVLIARPKPRSGSFKVLLATDGSASSDAAARSVAARPWPAGSEFRVLSVLELHLPVLQALFEPPFVDSATMEAWRGDAMKRAEDAVAAAVAALSPRIADVSESISVLTDGPRKIILNEAKEWDADLIVLGSHGRTGADRFLLGSVSEGVATHADRSVEVIRG